MATAEQPVVKNRRGQIKKDEAAVLAIAEHVRNSNRWSIEKLRETVDAIADELVTAGRL